jgi:hypothetical protein
MILIMAYRTEWSKVILKCEKILENSKEEHSRIFKGDTYEWHRANEIVNDPIIRQKIEFALKIIDTQ